MWTYEIHEGHEEYDIDETKGGHYLFDCEEVEFADGSVERRGNCLECHLNDDKCGVVHVTLNQQWSEEYCLSQEF